MLCARCLPPCIVFMCSCVQQREERCVLFEIDLLVQSESWSLTINGQYLADFGPVEMFED